MTIGGLQKLTLLDFPSRTASTVFLAGCNLCCPYCHNPGLVVPDETAESLPEGELLRSVLAHRQARRRLCERRRTDDSSGAAGFIVDDT